MDSAARSKITAKVPTTRVAGPPVADSGLLGHDGAARRPTDGSMSQDPHYYSRGNTSTNDNYGVLSSNHHPPLPPTSCSLLRQQLQQPPHHRQHKDTVTTNNAETVSKAHQEKMSNSNNKINNNERGTTQNKNGGKQRDKREEERETLVLVALDKLFDATTLRHGRSGVDEFMLRSAIEATLPLAPQTEKDKIRHRLFLGREVVRGGGGGGFYGNDKVTAGTGVTNRENFKHAMYSLFVSDRTTTVEEFIERVENESRRVMRKVAVLNDIGNDNNATNVSVPIPGTSSSSGARAQLISTTPIFDTVEDIGVKSEGAAVDGLSSEGGTKNETVNPSARGPANLEKTDKKSLMGSHKQSTGNSFMTIDEMEEEIRRLRAKCGEEERGKEKEKEEGEKADIPAVVGVSGFSATPPPAPPPLSSADVNSSATRLLFDSDAAATALRILHAERDAAVAALAKANEKLHGYGRFYDRQGDVIHRARMLAAATSPSSSASKRPTGWGSPHAADRALNRHGQSAITEPYEGFSPTRKAISADDALSMLLSSSPSAPSSSGRGVVDLNLRSMEHSNNGNYPRQDLADVSVAVPPNHVVPGSDTLLSAATPIGAGDLRQILLGSPYAPPRRAEAGLSSAANSNADMHASLHRNSAAASSSSTPLLNNNNNNNNNSYGYSSVNQPPFAQTSRIDAMYHVLALEKQETNRWRAYGAPRGGGGAHETDRKGW